MEKNKEQIISELKEMAAALKAQTAALEARIAALEELVQEEEAATRQQELARQEAARISGPIDIDIDIPVDTIPVSETDTPEPLSETVAPEGAYSLVSANEEDTAPSGVAPKATGASSRIRVNDYSSLGLPEATIRIACTKGTYIRAFARDLGEALGSGAFLESLCRTRTGDYSIDKALSLEQALALFNVVPNNLKTNTLP